MARYWSTPIKRVASKVARETRVVLAVRMQKSARNIQAYQISTNVLSAILQQTQNSHGIHLDLAQ